MRIHILLAVAMLLLAGRAAATRLLAFYEVKPAANAPTVDGVLDDPCWQGAAVADTYFKYWVPNPVPGELHTAFRMVYDDRGIYLAITNYEDDIANIRTRIRAPDVGDLWKDDCAEIYFDPTASGVGFSAFVVNALGFKHDWRRVDAAITLPDWSGYGWEIATKIGEKEWTIEGFFPWSDLGARAKVGDVWMFDHVRYGWSTGKFRGVTWSLGGANARADHFGYIAFVGGQPLPAERVGQILQGLVPPPWQLPAGNGFLVCAAKNEFRTETTADLLAKTVADLDAWQEKTAGAIQPDIKGMPTEAFDNWRAEYAAAPRNAPTPLAAVAAVNELQALKTKLVDIYWEARLRRLLTEL